MSHADTFQILLPAGRRTRALHAVAVKHASVDAGQTGLLSETETARLGRLVSPERQATLLRSLIAIRLCLAGRLSVPADSLRIAHDTDGAPSLPDFPQSSLSVSRTRHWTVLALSDGQSVGIDIEHIRPVDWQAMLSMISTDEEAGMLRALMGDGDALLPFYRAWTTKEAVMKAAGAGFRHGAKRVVVPERLLTGQAAKADIESNGAVYAVETGKVEDHCFAIALRKA